MKRLLKIFFVLSAIIASDKAEAQISGGIESNSALYLDDDKIKLGEFDAANRFRSNSYFRLDYHKGKFTGGVQVESYEPKALLNYSPKLKGTNLGTFYLKYKNYSLRLDITLGHFYTQFGSGLVFRTWEDRQLGIANSIAGAKVEYAPIKAIQLTTLYGKQRDGLAFDLSSGTVLGINAELSLSQMFKSKKSNYGIGLSYVNRKDPIASGSGIPQSTYLTSLRGNFQEGAFSIDAEYDFKSADALVEYGKIRPELPFDGDAYLVNIGYAKKGFGINTTFRRLENFAVYSQRSLAGNAFNEGFLNYVPALTKQYDYSLTNIYVYAAQPGISFEPDRNKAGEIGGQTDIVYRFKKGSVAGGKYGTEVSFNYAQWHGLSGRYEAFTRKYEADHFAFGKKYYHEAGLEIRKKLSEKVSGIITVLNQYYNARFVEETTGEVNANTVVIENTIKTGKYRSIRFELQHQWAKGGFRNWAAAQLEYNVGEKWSFFSADLYNYGNEVRSDRLHFYNVGAAFKKGSGRVQLSYGRQRGGLVCVGGVCRFVPENTGLNLNFNYSF